VRHPSKSVTTVWVVDAWSRITLLSELSEEKDFGLTWKHFEDRTGESEEALLALMAAAQCWASALDRRGFEAPMGRLRSQEIYRT
jgi:hypothetical protein